THDNVGAFCHQVPGVGAQEFNLHVARLQLDDYVPALNPAELRKLLAKRADLQKTFRVILGIVVQNANSTRLSGLLLCTSFDRPRYRRTADKCYEVAPPHFHPPKSQIRHRSGSSWQFGRGEMPFLSALGH